MRPVYGHPWETIGGFFNFQATTAILAEIGQFSPEKQPLRNSALGVAIGRHVQLFPTEQPHQKFVA